MNDVGDFSYRRLDFPGTDAPALAGYSLGNRSQWRYGTRSDEVLRNYEALGEELGLGLDRMVMPLETHTANVATVTAADGGGGVLRATHLANVDGVVTAERGLLLGITICDCVPVFLASVDGRAIGLLHCGWRGTRGGIVAEGVRQMELLGAERGRIRAVIGPHVCADCYEVGAELVDEFRERHTEDELRQVFWRQDGRLRLDLAASIRLQLLKEGIGAADVWASKECTYHGSEYFSYRRGDREMRNLAFLVIAE